MATMKPKAEWPALVSEHERWLSDYPQHLSRWKDSLKVNEEAAMTEAAFRRLLQEQGVHVEPNEDLGIGGPDLRCRAGEKPFYVEVTCVTNETAEKKRGISGAPTGKLCGVDPFGMAQAAFDKCMEKAKQVKGLDAPALIAVGTWNSVGFDRLTANYVAGGRSNLGWSSDLATGKQVGDTFQTTEFEAASFFYKLGDADEEELRPNRCSIAGLILSGLVGRETVGVLHPEAVRPFDPSLLPNIPFGKLEVDRAAGTIQVQWPDAKPPL